MATVTFTAGPKTKSYTITAGSLTRLGAWAAAAYPTIPNPAFNAAIPVDPVTNPRTITNPEPVLSAFDALFAGVKANVRSYEDQAAKTAIVPAADLT
jgi:hypothetical protein